MNRTVLTNQMVGNGHSYANDALLTICSKIHNYSNSEMLRLQQDIEDIAWLSDKVKDVELLTEKDQIRYHDLAIAQDNTLKLFDTIVSRGEEFAINFIEANSWAWK